MASHAELSYTGIVEALADLEKQFVIRQANGALPVGSTASNALPSKPTGSNTSPVAQQMPAIDPMESL